MRALFAQPPGASARCPFRSRACSARQNPLTHGPPRPPSPRWQATGAGRLTPGTHPGGAGTPPRRRERPIAVQAIHENNRFLNMFFVNKLHFHLSGAKTEVGFLNKTLGARDWILDILR